MKLKRLYVFLVAVLMLSGCTSAMNETTSDDIVAAPTPAEPPPTMTLPTLTPSLVAQMPSPPPLNAYPEPIVYPTSYPEPLTPIVVTPTPTAIPFPIVSTLPLTATWFYDSLYSTSCGYRLYLRTPEGDFLEWEQSIAGSVTRPNSPPLLLACKPGGVMNEQVEIRLVDVAAGTSIPLTPPPNAESAYRVYDALLSPDGQSFLFSGVPRQFPSFDESTFWGYYQADIATGEVIPMIQFSTDYDPEQPVDGTSLTWDFRTVIEWNENELIVHTRSSGNTRLWRFAWDENDPMPYTVGAGTLIVEEIEEESTWYPNPPVPYNEPSLPSHLQYPYLIYQPLP